ncbi:hypothetical protein pipiens_000846, partial [Culex pipiens pipiens]
MLEYGNFRASG